MPTVTYQQLLIEAIPQVIDTGKQYRELGARFADPIGKGSRRTHVESKLMRLLAVLI